MKILADAKTRKNDILTFCCFLLAAALLVWAAVAAWEHFRTSPPYVDRVRYPVMGIDISSHNGMMNLDAAAEDGIEFAWIKASEGATFRDKNFHLNYDKAGHAGMMRGAYHFFRFDKDGVEQGINLLKAVGNRPLEMGLAIDVESSGNPEGIAPEKIQERLAAMIDLLKLHGYGVTLYCNKSDYYKYLADNFPGSALWICSFSSTPIEADWNFWQFNHHGKVKGSKNDVDINVFNGSRQEWEAFIANQQYQGRKYVY